MFYMTWGRKKGDQGNCQFFDPLCTYEGMDSMLRLRYLDMGDREKGVVAPVGWVWNNLRSDHPGLELYRADESHPSYTGSFAAAATFYTMIWDKDPVSNSYNGSLSESDAQKIKSIVKEEVHQHRDQYDFRIAPVADFTYSPKNDSIAFLAKDVASEFYWDFGDGRTATGRLQYHWYQAPGDYTVTLIAQTCDRADTVRMKLTVTKTGNVGNTNNWNLKVYPNPSNGWVALEGISVKDSSHLRVLDSQGQWVEGVGIIQPTLLDISGLSPGVYLFIILNENREKVSFQLTIN
jgi:PKD repeat protein